MRRLLALLLLTACDDLNKPMNHPSSPKTPPESSWSTGDAGAPPDGAAPSPAPTITAAPGDIHI